MNIFRICIVLTFFLLIGGRLSWGQGVTLDGSPDNKWILHNPNDTRKTLFIAPRNTANSDWDWQKSTQFKSTGDVLMPVRLKIGSYDNILPSSTLEVLGDFRTTTGRFSSIYSQNTDGSYPTTYANTMGDAQLSIGANWTGSMTDLSLINSNIANTSGGGFSFWQMMGIDSKKMLAYMKGDGSVGFGGIIPTRALEVRGTNPIFRLGNSTPVNTQVNTVIGGIEFPTSGENAYMAKINANVGDFSDQPYLTFHTGSTSAEQVRITQSGNVGIGNLYPPAKLSVNGDIYSKGHMWLYAYEGEASSGTAYLQARNYTASTNINLQFRTQNAGQVVEAMHLNSSGNVGIGTTNPGTYKLAVEGKIGAREVEVKMGAWADFVFEPNYTLPSLKDVEAHIKSQRHLPGIPSEVEVKEKGYSLGAMDAKLLQKVEELTLYVIEQQKQINVQQKQIDQLMRLLNHQKVTEPK